MSISRKILSIFSLLVLLTLTFVTPAYAFEGRGGDHVVIKAGEVINDDLYVSAETFTLEGTVNGDLLVGAQTVIINGTVNGDLFAAAQTVIINGKVSDSARVGGAAVQIGSKAQIGTDLLVGGASLEMQSGSTVGRDLLVGSGQALLAGDVTRNVWAGTGALAVRGTVGGDMHAYVNLDENSRNSPPMQMYMTQSPIMIPPVQPGLTIESTARIDGNLQYTGTIDADVPAGVVGGKVTRMTPQVTEYKVAPHKVTPAQKVIAWTFGLLRSIATLILLGLLLFWLFPKFMKFLPETLKTQPLPSLGWGAITWAAFFFALLAIILVTILGGLVFGLLTLGGLSGTIIWLGILLFFGLTVLFILVTSFLTKVVVGDAIGKWVLARTSPSLAGHKIWPMVIGVTVLVLVIELLRFPLIPLGFLGFLVNFAVILFGLGTLWIWARESMRARKAAQ